MKRVSKVLLAAGLLMLVASLASAALTPLEQLGKNIYFERIGVPDRQACATCHAPAAGWVGSVAGINQHGAVYRGAMPQRFGNRKPPSAAYATTAPLFHYDPERGLFVGGNFWDGRATGERLGNPAADQALGPFLNPVEHNNPSKQAVLEHLAGTRYAGTWAEVWGDPLRFGTAAEIDLNYDRVGLALAAFEASEEVNAFTSKYDYVERGLATFTAQEALGKTLFEGEAMCAACHPAPLFTDYTFDNLGVPKNPDNPFYRMDEVLLDNGLPINPLGAAWIDPGLGGYLGSLPGSYFTALGLDKATTVALNMGKHKVPTLRNVDLRPNSAFPKAYAHNGVFKSLKEIVHFYNTRDVAPWPSPEVAANMNTAELGDLGLTDAEEDALVAFMGTLSDGYVPTNRGALMASAHVSTARALPPGLSVRYLAPGRYQFSYHLPSSGGVRVALYDVSGRMVRAVVDQAQDAGDHVIEWTAGDLPRGIYLLNLRAGTQQMSRKVFVAR